MSSLATYKAIMLREIEQAGSKRTGQSLEWATLPEDNNTRQRVLCSDALLWSLEQLERGDILHAMRGSWQAVEAMGRGNSGVWFSPVHHDAFGVIRDAIETRLREIERAKALMSDLLAHSSGGGSAREKARAWVRPV